MASLSNGGQGQIRLLLHLDPQPEGGFTVTCPLLPELITEGDTVEEVLVNVRDALAAVIELYEDFERPLPDGLSHPVADASSDVITLEAPVPIP